MSICLFWLQNQLLFNSGAFCDQQVFAFSSTLSEFHLRPRHTKKRRIFFQHRRENSLLNPWLCPREPGGDSRAVTFTLKDLYSIQEVDFLFTTETIIVINKKKKKMVDTSPTRSAAEKHSSISRQMTADVRLLKREVIRPTEPTHTHTHKFNLLIEFHGLSLWQARHLLLLL